MGFYCGILYRVVAVVFVLLLSCNISDYARANEDGENARDEEERAQEEKQAVSDTLAALLLKHFHFRKKKPGPPKIESFSGVDATSHSVFGYYGVVFSPASWGGKVTLYDEGFRLRFLGGYGGYEYHSNLQVQGTSVPVRFTGETTVFEAMAGYAFVRGPVTLKTYFGAVFEGHDVSPLDPDNKISGDRYGAKAQAELWVNLGKSGWLSADAGFSTPFQSFSGHMKIGMKPVSWLSIGPEAAFLGNEEFETGRAGGFLRYHNSYGDFTLSGGVTGSYQEADGIYASMSFASKF